MQAIKGTALRRVRSVFYYYFRAQSTMGQIYHDLENIRPQLFRLTAETEHDNDEIMLILRLKDS